jgi:hypothetical protein
MNIYKPRIIHTRNALHRASMLCEVRLVDNRVSIGADTGGWGIDPPHFYSSIVSFAVSGGDYPPEQKIFRLSAFAIIIPPTCESESAPLRMRIGLYTNIVCTLCIL